MAPYSRQRDAWPAARGALEFRDGVSKLAKTLSPIDSGPIAAFRDAFRSWPAVSKPHPLVSRDDFDRAYARWDDDCTGEPPFGGRLSAAPPGYDGLFLEPVRVQLRTATERPLFLLDDHSSHRLAKEQRNGITAAEWHAIVADVMPWIFAEA